MRQSYLNGQPPSEGSVLQSIAQKLKFSSAVVHGVVSDFLTGVAHRLGFPCRTSGHRFQRLAPEASAQYILNCWAWAKGYCRSELHGHICEIGPGNSRAAALMFRHEGFEKVTLIDRYPIDSAPGDPAIIQELSRKLSVDSNYVTGSLADSFLNVINNQMAEEFFAQKQECFDVIYSNAVLEHLDAPIRSLDDMYAALRPGGTLLHVIDLRNHGLLQSLGELKWLEISDSLFHHMRRNTARPNRVLYHEYAAWAQRTPGAQIYVQRILGSDHNWVGKTLAEIDASDRQRSSEIVRNQRSNLNEQFSVVSDENLGVAVIVLVAEKPEGG